jgi:hypothetical protein
MQVTVISGANGSVLVPPFSPFTGSPVGGSCRPGTSCTTVGTRSSSPRTGPAGRGSPSTISTAPRWQTAPKSTRWRADAGSELLHPQPELPRGARTAVGDLNGDGIPTWWWRPGTAVGPPIVVINGTRVIGTNGFTPSDDLVGNFYGFSSSLRDGAYMAVGDVLGNGQQDLILGRGDGGPAEVEVLSGRMTRQRGGGGRARQPGRPVHPDRARIERVG